ncbi:MAG: hypothetical protein ACRD1G_08455, partial [Acidimicrobiales bacterium]
AQLVQSLVQGGAGLAQVVIPEVTLVIGPHFQGIQALPAAGQGTASPSSATAPTPPEPFDPQVC